MKNLIITGLFLSIAILCFSCGTTVFAQSVGGASVQTNSATNISNYQATLNGYLAIPYISNSNYVWFQWGTTFGYGNQTNQQYLNNGSFSQVISGLNYNTTYHFRAVAQGSFGTIYGQDMTFFSGQSNNNNYGNCTYHSYEACVGNNLYWYDSCGNQQDLIQYCTNGCSGNSCSYNNNYNYNYNNYGYGNCTYHAYRLCSGNNIYWYDSCGNQQDLIQSCGGGLVCQYGQCTNYVIVNPVLPPIQPINIYNPYSTTACYNGSIRWFDSLGVVSGLYKNCNDKNSCTIDSCSANKCSHTLKCGGSTCAVGTTDYNKYCAASQPVQPINQGHCGNGLCEPNLGETTDTCPTDCKINTNTNTNTVVSGLSTSFFTKQDSTSNQWQKTAQVGSNGQIYFMISVANSSANPIDNVIVSANIPDEIFSLGNLQLNGVLISGDIVSGVNIGSLAPSTAKSITFEGKTQNISINSSKQATVTTDVSGAKESDSVSINLVTGQQTAAAVSSGSTANGFWDFLKRWYLWILVGIVLVFLFIIVFRRLSSNA